MREVLSAAIIVLCALSLGGCPGRGDCNASNAGGGDLFQNCGGGGDGATSLTSPTPVVTPPPATVVVTPPGSTTTQIEQKQ